ncbi:hypothetical protein BGZ49_000951, partial [Haplosporangium sp. Z 27]
MMQLTANFFKMPKTNQELFNMPVNEVDIRMNEAFDDSYHEISNHGPVEAETFQNSSTFSSDNIKQAIELYSTTNVIELKGFPIITEDGINVGSVHTNHNVNNPLKMSQNINDDYDNLKSTIVVNKSMTINNTPVASDLSIHAENMEDSLGIKSDSKLKVNGEHQVLPNNFVEHSALALPYGSASYNLVVPVETVDRLRSHADRMDLTIASMCHVAWAQVLSKMGGQEQVAFETEISGLIQAPSVSNMPIHIDVGYFSVEETLRRTKARLADLMKQAGSSSDIPENCGSLPSEALLFNSLLSYRDTTVYANDENELNGLAPIQEQEQSKYTYIMSIEDVNNTFGLRTQVLKPHDSGRICGYMQQALIGLADALDHTPTMPVQDIDIIPNEEREMLLESWNKRTLPYPQDQCIHQVFESQVKQNPDAIAAVFEDQEITYRELNARANSLAHHLIDLGVKPDSLVAICVSRSIAVVIALMAVLKAGGAYVPLDPTFASDRLSDILADASPSVLLADKSGLAALNLPDSSSIEVVDPNVLLGDSITNPTVPGLMPHHLAYVIYTSGSTGKPKGVMIEHRGVVNLAITRPAVFGVGPSSRVLQFFSFSFDGSVHDIWSALCSGGSLHILPDHIRQDRYQLWSYMKDQAITHALITPAVLQDCQDLSVITTPITIALGGDALSFALLKALRKLIPNGSILNDYGPTEATVDA